MNENKENELNELNEFVTREELITSKEYWIGEIQIGLYNVIEDYLKNKNITRAQFATDMGVTKGYVSQILNGDYNHKISKFVELALKVGKVPRVDFVDVEDILISDSYGMLHDKSYKNVNLIINKNTFISPSKDLGYKLDEKDLIYNFNHYSRKNETQNENKEKNRIPA